MRLQNIITISADETENEYRLKLPADPVGSLVLCENGETATYLQNRGYAVCGVLTRENQESGEEFKGISYLIEAPEEIEWWQYEKIYGRLNGIPWNILETENLLLRETTVEDVKEFYEIYSQEHITDYLEELFEDYEEECDYIRKYIKNIYGFYEYGMWTIVEKASKKVIGRAGIEPGQVFDNYKELRGKDIAELGYVIGRPWQNKGYATEVCKAILDFSKDIDGLEGVAARMSPRNEASIALCRKLKLQELVIDEIVDKASIRYEGEKLFYMAK